MNNQNIYTYLLPFHWSKEKNFEHRKEDNRYAIKDIKEYENIMNKLKRLKKDKIKIINSNEFLEDSKNYIKNLDWKCKSENFELRVDSDGKLACCCDKLGQVNNVYTIFDIEDNKIYTDFINLRKKDVKECEGCLWPSSYEASIYE